jgi:hypothetical protein
MAMYDELRKQADVNPFTDDSDDFASLMSEPAVETRRLFLGLTPLQRLAISILLLVLSILMSATCLLATGRIGL